MSKKRLVGKIILNTRPLEQALLLTQAIEKEGGKCISLPSIEILPVEISEQHIKEQIQSDFWIFVSQSAVQFWASRYRNTLKNTHTKIVAIGNATAKALQRENILVDFIPLESSSEGVLALPSFQSLQEKTVTIFRGKAGRTLLDETLKERGAFVKEVVLYERVASHWSKKDYALLDKPIDLALGLSIDSLTYFFSKLSLNHKQWFFNVPWLVMSQRVAEEAKKLGILNIYRVSDGDIFESLIRCCSSEKMGVDL